MMKIFVKSLMIFSLLAFISCTTTSKQESTGEYIDSATITAKVKAALVANKNVSAMDIKVVTYKQVVQLSGFVDSQGQKNIAHDIASRVEGVKEVVNNLVVK